MKVIVPLAIEVDEWGEVMMDGETSDRKVRKDIREYVREYVEGSRALQDLQATVTLADG